jgi:hypothetical protein
MVNSIKWYDWKLGSSGSGKGIGVFGIPVVGIRVFGIPVVQGNSKLVTRMYCCV